ncbi:MAG: glutathione S-transferase N-terminal domain-containing protein [Candidatus Binataceae bacterium]
MIDVYFWTTPNGYKVTIMLEELGLKYNVIPINIRTGDQFKPDFLKISPNNKIPAIVDHEGPDGQPLAMFESGAILMYLAEKTGKLMPRDTRARYEVIQWLMFQMASIGPMFGQNNHFRRAAPDKIPYAIDRYSNETRRLYGVMDKRLAEAEYLAGDYSIADVATFPWTVRHDWHEINLDEFPNVGRWFKAIESRPAVVKGRAVMADEAAKPPAMDPKSQEILYGKSQYQRR